MYISDMRSIEELVESNESVIATKNNDMELLKNLITLGTGDLKSINDIFIPDIFIDENQEEFIKKFNNHYKDETNNMKRRIVSKLIQYLNMYIKIREENYELYIILLDELKTAPNERMELKKDKNIEMCEELLKDPKININVKLYAYIIKTKINIKPKTLVELTIEKSENYIDFINKKIIITETKKGEREIELTSEDITNIIKIILPNKDDIEYEDLLKSETYLLMKLQKIRKKYLFEKLKKQLTGIQLSQALSFKKKNI